MNYCPNCGSNQLIEVSSEEEPGRTHVRYRCDFCSKLWEVTTFTDPHGDYRIRITEIDEEE